MADKNSETPVEELSFKEASIELEQVVRSLESLRTPLRVMLEVSSY